MYGLINCKASGLLRAPSQRSKNLIKTISGMSFAFIREVSEIKQWRMRDLAPTCKSKRQQNLEGFAPRQSAKVRENPRFFAHDPAKINDKFLSLIFAVRR